ncbi:hypothetical protein [Streptomyces fractus]|uniref:hypothetical protein n=1 Tax=Streptomyces fractus TaxID=641806 RepID=UPI003CF0271A
MLVEIHLDQRFLLCGLIGEGESELAVDLGFVGGDGVADDGGEVADGAALHLALAGAAEEDAAQEVRAAGEAFGGRS